MKNKIIEAAKVVLPQEFALEVLDVSHKHAGHGHGLAGESHFELILTGKKLAVSERLGLHKKLNAALGPLYSGGVHSIEIKIKQID